MTASLCRCSAQWEGMPSHKSFCRSQPACFNINSRLQKQFTPPAGLRRTDLWVDTWDDMSHQQVLLEGHSPSTWRERPLPAVIAYACNQSGIQHLGMRTPSFATSMAWRSCRSASSSQRAVWDANSSSVIHSTSTRVSRRRMTKETLRLEVPDGYSLLRAVTQFVMVCNFLSESRHDGIAWNPI